MAIEILTHNDGIRHSGFEGQTVETTTCLLILVACALQYQHKTGTNDLNVDPVTIEDLADNFSSSEIQKGPYIPDSVWYSA